MKKYNVFLVLMCFVNTNFSMQRGACPLQRVYRHALECDIAPILQALEAAENTADADNIVILPRKFREKSLREAIEKKRMFVAYNQQHQLMGFKKLYVLVGQERDDVLCDEIRCAGSSGFFCSGTSPHIINETRCYVYTGADYTVPEFRGQGVNKELMEYAFSTLRVTKEKVVVVFGVTNASFEIKRHLSIIKAVKKFLHQVRGQDTSLKIACCHAEKPTFDADAQECVPLDHGVIGFGYVLEEL